MTTATSADRRKRVFSDRTLTLGDLRAIHGQLAGTGQEVRIVANDTHLFDLDPLPTLAAEDVVIREITMSVIGEDDEVLRFTYDPSYIEVQAGLDRAFRRPFAIVAALLENKPANSMHSCMLDLADTRTPKLPTVAISDEPTSDSRRARKAEVAQKKKAAAEAVTERMSAPLREPSSLELATERMQRATAKKPDTVTIPAASSASALREPTPMIDPGTVRPVTIADAKPPSSGLVALLRRLWRRSDY